MNVGGKTENGNKYRWWSLDLWLGWGRERGGEEEGPVEQGSLFFVTMGRFEYGYENG